MLLDFNINLLAGFQTSVSNVQELHGIVGSLVQLSNVLFKSGTIFSTWLCLVSTQVYSTAWKKAKTEGKVGKQRWEFAVEARKKFPG